MTTNPYFKNYNSSRQQFLVESLLVESIKRYGYDIKYIPRKIGNIDHIFGEDTTSSFERATTVEVYVKSVDGFAGQGRFLSKFGVEVRDTITFTIARLRFDQIKTPKLMDERGTTVQLEERPLYRANNSFAIELEGDQTPYTIESDKPLEGDLIFFPLVNKMFEIKYVNFETIFYQKGALQVYDLECEMFEYSNEDFRTPETDINDLLNGLSTDIRDTSVLMEENTHLMMESSGRLILEEYDINEGVVVANNSVFHNQAEDVVDFSEKSPLVRGDIFNRW